MLPFLTNHCDFPPVSQALDEPNGLLAAGGNLSSNRLMTAYRNGIFPWYSEGEPILWWSPNPRTVFDIKQFKPSRSLCRFIKQCDWKLSLNSAFDSVITACSKPRNNQPTSWISPDIIEAYNRLHDEGVAHSVEVRSKNRLVGGIYGVVIGNIFCGESMFSLESNASKTALACLIGYLRQYDFSLVDCQVDNPHLTSLGAVAISRCKYIQYLEIAANCNRDQNMWVCRDLNYKQLITRQIR
jgi:leucyl/phenylalanyl-tRNA---protein transferase